MRRNKFNGDRGGHRSSERTMVQRIDPTDSYFVPSFSVRRHVTRDSEAELTEMQDQVRRRLGNKFSITPTSQLTLKLYSQKQLIMRMREADLRPSPTQMRDLAYRVCDGLFDLLHDAPSPLRVPLGKLGLFGYNNQALGIEIEGWRGHKARYATHDKDGTMTPHGTLVTESRYCLDRFNDEFEGTGFDGRDILCTPHKTIARYGKGVHEGTMREIQHKLSDVLLTEVEVGDPVIEFRGSRASDSEILYVRNAWSSLGVV